MKKNKRYLLIICLFQLIIFERANSQGVASGKPVITFGAIDKWTYVDRPNISPDGRFGSCLIENKPTGFQTLKICSIDNSWSIKLVAKDLNYGNAFFTNDNKYVIFQPNDSLGILTLGTSQITYIPLVSRMEMLKGNLPNILYETKGTPKETIIYDLENNKQLLTINCENYIVSPDGHYLIYELTSKKVDSTIISKVIWCDLTNLSQQIIWKGNEANNFTFNITGDKLAYIAKRDSQSEPCVMFYQKGSPAAKMLVSKSNIPLTGYAFSSLIGFTRDGTMLYLTLKDKIPAEIPSPEKAKVDIWNFNDPMIQEEQLARNIKPDNEFFAVLHLENNKIYPLCKSQGMYWDPSDKNFSDRLFLYVNNAGGEINEGYWNKYALDTVSLINAISGKKKVIDYNLSFGNAGNYKLSPSGEYILYYDNKTGDYFSYSVKTGTRINLTKNIHSEWSYATFKVQKIQGVILRGIAGWIKNTNEVLLQSRYGIWRVSLDGSNRPVCITKGYGKAHHIQFRMAKSFGNENTLYNEDQVIYLSAFNPQNKQNGFFSANINGQRNPVMLTMSNCDYFVPWTDHSWGEIEPVKARNVKAWLVGRQRSDESVNYFFTKDFKEFKPISHNYPERKFNWLTTQLINWKLPDGHISQGILYKPDNFDSTKKYPLIFLYYEELSNDLNEYEKPERSTCNINIPYYVSNGYLIFTPDIERTKNGAGQDALNTMVSAAKYLSKLPYVDGSRLGLCGTSMGGYKTNYIVTHSHLFATANTISGPSSIASFGLSLWGDALAIGEVEVAQFYIGHSIVERPDLYVTNSPIFYIKNVQTPILMMYNKEDKYNYVDGVAMFQALRRSGKRAWMLQYNGQGHFLDDRDTIITTDYTIRQKQFFDHYLMGKPAPIWMTRGIPAWEKGIKDGFELDTTIKTPMERLLTPDAKKLEESSQNKKMIVKIE